MKDAFPKSRINIEVNAGQFSLVMEQHGLLRPLAAAELSDGTLRYLLWVAVLLTPRPLALMVLNEPEASLHPDLLGPLARFKSEVLDAQVIPLSCLVLGERSGDTPNH